MECLGRSGSSGLLRIAFYVLQLLFLRSFADVADGLGIDVNTVDDATRTHALRGPNGEPSRAGANVGNSLPLSNAENLHHAVDLQPILAARTFKNRQIASVWFAGFALPF